MESFMSSFTRAVAFSVLFYFNSFGGIPASSLVFVDVPLNIPVESGHVLYKQVKNLEYGDRVVSFTGKKLKSRKVNCIVKSHAYSLVNIYTKSGDFVLSKQHLVFDPVINAWIESKKLTTENFVMDINFKAIPVTGAKKIMLPKKVDVYDFIVDKDSCFFIVDSSGNKILIHNHPGFWSGIWDSFKRGTAVGLAIGIGKSFDELDAKIASESAGRSFNSNRNDNTAYFMGESYTRSRHSDINDMRTRRIKMRKRLEVFRRNAIRERLGLFDEYSDEEELEEESKPVHTGPSAFHQERLSRDTVVNNSRRFYSQDVAINLGNSGVLNSAGPYGAAIAGGGALAYGAYKYFSSGNRGSGNSGSIKVLSGDVGACRDRLNLSRENLIRLMKTTGRYGNASELEMCDFADDLRARDIDSVHRSDDKRREDSRIEYIAKHDSCLKEEVTVSKEYFVMYGEEVKVYTTPKGKIFFEENAQKIKEIVDEAALSYTRSGSRDRQPKFRENTLSHMFNGIKGHHTKTPENLKKVLRLTRNKANRLGPPDERGNTWYGKIVNGKQEWSRVFENEIVGAGVNKVPRVYDKLKGLCKLKAPGK